jgi:hypothetical protein
MPLEEKFCPLCGRAAVIVTLTDQDAYNIDCQCCGKFIIAGLWWDLDVSHFSEDDSHLLRYLSCYTRQTSESGITEVLDSSNWRERAQRHMSTPIAQKIKKCLGLIAKRASSYGNDGDITPNLDYPLVDVNSAEALETLLTDLQREGYLTYRASSGRLVCSLTIAGWKNLEQSTTSANVEKPQGVHINTRLLCFGWPEANRHLARPIDCLANNEVKSSSARCPSSRHLWAYRINPSMSACAC